MAVKSLWVLHLGTEADIDKGFQTFGVDKGKMVENAFSCYLIRTDEGNILVDTGMHPEDVEMWNSMGSKITQRPEDQLPQRLKEVGLSTEDINLIVMTHLHWDHVGCLTYLLNAEVVVQKEEYSFALDPTPYASALYFPKRYNLPEIKWKLVDGDQILMPGLTILFTPGHTAGHQSVMVDLPKFGPILIAGDAGFLQENFEKELIPVFFDDPRQALLSIRKLKVWSNIRKAPIFPTHDIDYWRQQIIKSPEAYT